MIYDFNGGWYCRSVPCGEWREVVLPHDAMRESTRAESVGTPEIGWFSGGDVEYKKTFKRPNGKVFVLEFEGVYKDAEVYVNGVFAGGNDYGYICFYIDVSKYLKDGENEISVVAKNSDQPNSRWYTGTGIYRPVRLFALPEKHILPSGVKVRTVSVSPAVVAVSVATSDGGIANVVIEDENGRVVASGTVDGTAEFEIAEARLWSVDSPRLYTCRAEYCDDERAVKFGIRTVACDYERGFTLNGERVVLRGACIHHDNGILGAMCFAESEERKIELLKKAGYNAVRSAHNPCSKALLDACDRQGMLVLDEYADMWYIRKTKYDYALHAEQNCERDVAAMVEKDYNHPSVVMYSLGNEVAETSEERGVKMLARMVDAIKSRDDRPVTVGVNPFFNYLYSLGFGQYSDKKAEKGSNKKVGSEFFNMLAGKLGAGFMKTMAKLGGCDRRTRAAYALLDVAGYNYGIKRYARDLEKYPRRVILGSETFCADAYAFWEIAKREHRVIGDFVWAGMDYIGEIGVGAWERTDYAPVRAPAFGWMTAGSGRLDLVGNELGEAAYTRVAFEIDVRPKIAVSPVSRARKHTPSAWKFSDALESWSWGKDNDGVKTRVEVYSRAHVVELLINGKSAGKKKFEKNCRFCFDVKYERGEVTAIERDGCGKELARTSLRSAGDDTVITLAAEKKRADDGVYYIGISYTDGAGVWKPCENGRLRATVFGGERIALGCARPFNPDGFTDCETETYYGRALCIVRGGAGTRVAVSDGIRSAEIVLSE